MNQPKTMGEAWAQYEQTIMDRALVLCKGQSPFYNIHPLVELIRQADKLGYAVVSKADVRPERHAAHCPCFTCIMRGSTFSTEAQL